MVPRRQTQLNVEDSLRFFERGPKLALQSPLGNLWLSRLLYSLLAIVTSWTLIAQPLAAQAQATASPGIDFVREIAPLLSARCLQCHGPETAEGGVRLDRAENALAEADSGSRPIVPGDPAASHLLELVAGEEPEMPEGGPPLTAEEIERLRVWIASGADWPTGFVIEPRRELWSVQPLAVTEPVPASNPSEVLDRFVERKLFELGLQRSAPAAPQTLIRRLFLDVIGLPPSQQEVNEFVADPSDARYAQLVDRLLASPQYGERWGRHWLDVVRFAESNGFETNVERPSAYHYRDWVIEALNQDLPYNRFLALQIAGDQLGEDRATGFLVGGPWDQVKSPDPILTQNQRQDELADIVNTTGTAFFGLTLGCARCHHHKFDPITHTDYFALASLFAGVQHGERQLKNSQQRELEAQVKELNARRSQLRGRMLAFEPVFDPTGTPPQRRAAVNSRENIDRFAPVTAKWIRFTCLQTNQAEPCLDELEVWALDEVPTAAGRPESPGAAKPWLNVGLVTCGAKASSSGDYPDRSKHRLEQVNDGRVGNDYSWISSESGKGWVEIELPAEQLISAVVWGRDRNQVYRDRTPIEYRIEVARQPGEWQTVATEADRLPFGGDAPAAVSEAVPPTAEWTALQRELEQLDQSIAALHRQITLAQSAYVGTFVSQPEPTKRLERGEVTAPQEVVGPGLPQLLGDLELPVDATDGERRLTLARWLETSAHPLLARVIVNRVWQFHFGQGLAGTPSDFGTKGVPPSHPDLLDWLAAELVARGWSLKAIHKLVLLSATYRQDNKPRSEALRLDAGNQWLWRFQPRRLESEAIRDAMLLASGELDLKPGGPGFSAFEPNDNYVRVYLPRETFGPNEFRRMIYMQKIRMEQDATFGTFDTPDAAQVCPVRSRSVTPLQALNLLNSPFVLGRAATLAGRLQAEAGDQAAAQIDAAYRLLFGRSATEPERIAAERLVAQYGLTALCRALLNSNEFLILP